MKTETQRALETRGVVDALDRILRELIRTPKFKETVITLLKAVDPPAARGLVRTIFWQDPGLLMSVLGTLPQIANTVFQALAEIAAQMNSMPKPLLLDLLHRIAEGLDGAALGEAAGGLHREAAEIVRRFEVGSAVLGGFIGMVIGWQLLAVSLRRTRTTYEIDPAACVSCGRCYRSCPIEVARKAGRTVTPLETSE